MAVNEPEIKFGKSYMMKKNRHRKQWDVSYLCLDENHDQYRPFSNVPSRVSCLPFISISLLSVHLIAVTSFRILVNPF